ncbi:MAG: DUF5686 family protein, partial [Ignavibacteriales bacterium]|nr:DUF5686 family protein [Ignavibacteriales bacterium]
IILSAALRAGISESFSLTGSVLDRESGRSLPGANVFQPMTTHGTVTNTDGKFRILVSSGGSVVASLLGYRSDTLKVSGREPMNELIFRLEPSMVLVPGITVFSDAPNPADVIMQRVIERKKGLGKFLDSYKFSGYIKTTFGAAVLKSIVTGDSARVAPDSLFYSLVFETMTNGYWSAPDRLKEELVSRRQPKLIPPEFNLFTALRSPSVLSDEILIMDRLVPSPTAPDAFDYYQFRILDTIADGSRAVWKIGIIPRLYHEPLFRGTLWVEDGSFDICKASLAGNEQLLRPAIHCSGIEQQFSRFRDSISGKAFIMPLETRVRYEVTSFRKGRAGEDSALIAISQIFLYSDYRFNPILSSDFFDEIRVFVLPTADDGDTTLWDQRQRIPLTAVEQRTIGRLDSLADHPTTASIALRFMMVAPIFLAKSPFTEVYDYYHFNRIEGSYIGGGLTSNRLFSSTLLTMKAGYGTANQRWSFLGEAEQYSSGRRRHSIGVEVHRRLECTDAGSALSAWTPSLMSLLFKDDPADYFETDGWTLFARTRVIPRVEFEVRFLAERHRSVRVGTEFSIFNRSASYRINPPIQDGLLQSVTLRWKYDSRDYFDFGLFKSPDVSRRSWQCEAICELASKRLIGGDYSFVRTTAQSEWNLPAYGNTLLNIKMRAGWSWDVLPPQRLFDLVGAGTVLVPDWGFSALRTKEFSGDKCLSLYIEHNLGNVFAKWLGLSLLEDYTLSIMGGGGWSDISSASRRILMSPLQTANIVYWEAGFGVGGFFDALQLDFTSRLTHLSGGGVTISLRTSFL